MGSDTEQGVQHCRGVLAASGEVCDRRVLRCLRCGHSGCNQIDRAMCSEQGFVALDCQQCHALGEIEVVSAESPT